MNTDQYCESVDRKVLLHLARIETIPVVEDNSPLISLRDSAFDLQFEPSIIQDYKYLVREEVFEKIGRISKQLTQENKVLVIRSVWRSFQHQQLLWDNSYQSHAKKYPDKSPEAISEMVRKFIAPGKKSMHSTGGAVDALIYDRETDTILDFGTNRGLKIYLSKKCYPQYPDIPPSAKKNRKLLIDLFEREDFVCDLREYWHFDYGNSSWAVEKEKAKAIYGILQKFESSSGTCCTSI